MVGGEPNQLLILQEPRLGLWHFYDIDIDIIRHDENNGNLKFSGLVSGNTRYKDITSPNSTDAPPRPAASKTTMESSFFHQLSNITYEDYLKYYVPNPGKRN